MPDTLLQRLTTDESLLLAWHEVRRGGKTPGIDGVSLPRFERKLTQELKALRRELLSGTYSPWPTRRLHLPKDDGSTRAIGVQAVRDRVAQRALLALLQPRVEAQLEDAAYAYRPNRSIEKALTKLEGWRAAGLVWVARADVKTCFDAIEHTRMERALLPVLPESEGRELIHRWLSAGAVDAGGYHPSDGDGLPQGDVLSPLLCNLFLDPFDEAVQAKNPLIRYADDIVIVAKSEKEVRAGLGRAEAALTALGLTLNRKKEWVGTFSQGFTFLGAAICGSLRLPLHPVAPGKWDYGYGPPSQPAASRPPLATPDAVTERLTTLLRLERKGAPLTSMESAFLAAWRTQPAEDRLPEGWQSVYLV